MWSLEYWNYHFRTLSRKPKTGWCEVVHKKEDATLIKLSAGNCPIYDIKNIWKSYSIPNDIC